MPEQGAQERTEKATFRRRQKAREEGKVAKSQELNSAAILLLGCLSLWMLGPHLSGQIRDMMSYTMSHAPQIAAADPTYIRVFGDYVVRFFLIMFPVFVVLTVIGLTSNIAQIGFKITPKSLEPKFEKLDVLKGLKRLFAVKSLVQLIRDVIKLTIVVIVAYNAMASEFDTFFLLPDMTVAQLAGSMGKLALVLGMKVGAMMIAIGILDYLYQKYEFEKSIKMSKQDLKDENKDTEGSPLVKSRVRQIQREMARQRMMAAVPLADAVITNPTHLAVALKYELEKGNAPYVLAKGERLIAERIKEIAREHDIPIIEDKPLARALFKMCDVGDFVPAQLYRAVAELLAYVYRLKGKVIK
ncbi:MAG: flagellar biosynthesis protein FlhB [candidate division Zixibacteria bacterium]|nr:flagellar biosynthesis protein FlhB [candidate division Zixibacteria bacterium]